jgi:hypothetical protein
MLLASDCMCAVDLRGEIRDHCLSSKVRLVLTHTAVGVRATAISSRLSWVCRGRG